MPEPTSRRKLWFAALAVALAAVPVSGQMDWSRVANQNGPTSSGSGTIANDTARQRVVLFLGNWSPITTWEWDGNTWTQRASTTTPSGRWAEAMAYDARRQRTVLFGGNQGSRVAADTWEWDGRNWTQLNPATSPPARYGHAMAFDAARQRIVLFGGWSQSTWSKPASLYTDTWEWDGRNWTRLTPATSPPGRCAHTMAYDAARQRIVLFGGGTGNGILNDTWEWDGKNWTSPNPATSPTPRWGQGMAYDARRQRIVLFSGISAAIPLSDTWEWDGRNWTQHSPATTPPRTLFPEGMAFDAAKQRIVVFGVSNWTQLHETWEWDGNDWSKVTPSTGHPPRCLTPATAYDSARQRIVLFGGSTGISLLNETWERDGSTWTRKPTATSPPPRFELAMAYDAARKRVVLFGGHTGRIPPQQVFGDTWEYDGTSWIRQNPATSPVARFNHTMAYDAHRQRTVLFGGSTATTDLNDTWEWDGINWKNVTPSTASPTIRGSHGMAYDAARRRAVLFGGRRVIQAKYPSITNYNDTWEWDGISWRNVTPSTGSPTPRGGHNLAYDAARQRVVLFGGSFWSGGKYGMRIDYNDTWTWNGNTWTQDTPVNSPPLSSFVYYPMVFDAARGAMILLNAMYYETWAYAPHDLTASTRFVSVTSGGRVKLSIDAGITYAGKGYLVLGCIDSNRPRGIPSLKLNLRLNPDAYFWLTMQIPNPLIANSLGFLDASGKATATIHVPPLPPALIGWRFYHAYVVFRSRIDHASTPVPLTLAP